MLLCNYIVDYITVAENDISQRIFVPDVAGAAKALAVGSLAPYFVSYSLHCYTICISLFITNFGYDVVFLDSHIRYSLVFSILLEKYISDGRSCTD